MKLNFFKNARNEHPEIFNKIDGLEDKYKVFYILNNVEHLDYPIDIKYKIESKCQLKLSALELNLSQKEVIKRFNIENKKDIQSVYEKFVKKEWAKEKTLEEELEYNKGNNDLEKQEYITDKDLIEGIKDNQYRGIEIPDIDVVKKGIKFALWSRKVYRENEDFFQQNMRRAVTYQILKRYEVNGIVYGIRKEDLAKEMQIAKGSLDKAIKELEERNIIEVYKKDRLTPPTFFINKELEKEKNEENKSLGYFLVPENALLRAKEMDKHPIKAIRFLLYYFEKRHHMFNNQFNNKIRYKTIKKAINTRNYTTIVYIIEELIAMGVLKEKTIFPKDYQKGNLNVILAFDHDFLGLAKNEKEIIKVTKEEKDEIKKSGKLPNIKTLLKKLKIDRTWKNIRAIYFSSLTYPKEVIKILVNNIERFSESKANNVNYALKLMQIASKKNHEWQIDTLNYVSQEDREHRINRLKNKFGPKEIQYIFGMLNNNDTNNSNANNISNEEDRSNDEEYQNYMKAIDIK